jgi:hypothetical protein
MKTKFTFLTLLLVVLISGGSHLTAAKQKQPEKKVSQFWWQVELHIAVEGGYAYGIDNKGFNGNYSFAAVVLGSMEEDEDDFIFLQAYLYIRDMKWKETAFNQNRRRESDLSEKIKPDVTVNYVFHEKGILSFDFDFKPVPVPSKSTIFSKPVKHLRFPESVGDDSVKARVIYNQGIIDGSDRVALASKDIYDQKEVNRVFQWKWREVNASKNTGMKHSWENSHQVEIKLKMIRLVKKKDTKPAIIKKDRKYGNI